MHQRRVCVLGDRCQPTTDKGRLNCAILHHPGLSAEQIAIAARIKYARLLKYASESQSDRIPADALNRVCDVTNRWDLLDASLQPFGRRTVALTLAADTASSPLDEAVDMQSAAALVLKAVRDLGRGGYTPDEKVVILAMLRDIRREADDVEAALNRGPRLATSRRDA